MWKCKHCSEQLEDTFDSCWSCGYSRDGLPPRTSEDEPVEEALLGGEPLSHPTPSGSASRSRPQSGIVQSLTRRYSDAYIAARALVVIGGIIKWVGVVLAIIILIIGFVMSSGSGSGGVFAFVGFALACLIGVPTFVLGILISAQGQIHLATLDTAVNTSRHLNKDDVAKILVGRNA